MDENMDMMAFLNGFMGALFSNDPQALMEKAQEAGKMIGEAAYTAHEEAYTALIRRELQPLKDAILLLTPTIDHLGDILAKVESVGHFVPNTES